MSTAIEDNLSVLNEASRDKAVAHDIENMASDVLNHLCYLSDETLNKIDLAVWREQCERDPDYQKKVESTLNPF